MLTVKLTHMRELTNEAPFMFSPLWDLLLELQDKHISSKGVRHYEATKAGTDKRNTPPSSNYYLWLAQQTAGD